jgi:RNA polymerase sigma factor (sigma-70 family)
VPAPVEDWYRRYSPMVLRRCRALLRDEAWAVEAHQDVFVQVMRRADALDDTAPSSLLYRMATQICLNHLRSRRRRPEDAADELVQRIAAVDDATEATVATRGVLDWLFAREPESTRVMAVLHYVDGLTLEETAEAMGLSVSGVRKRLRRLASHTEALAAVEAP